jgi:hypothetical protein
MAQNMASTTPDQTLKRISALFTFGCPLNKVFYFFRARTSSKTYVLDEILYSLHNLRLRNPAPAGAHQAPEPFHPSFRWFNAWCPMDVISGRMLFYRADQNQVVKQGFEPATAHTGYWKNPKLYAFFAKLLFTQQSATTSPQKGTEQQAPPQTSFAVPARAVDRKVAISGKVLLPTLDECQIANARVECRSVTRSKLAVIGRTLRRTLELRVRFGEFIGNRIVFHSK